VREGGRRGGFPRRLDRDDPITEKYDVFIFSWYCYSYIPDRATRISALRAASRHLAPGGGSSSATP